MDSTPIRSVILGASRGLGRALVEHICAEGHPVVGFSRKENLLRSLREAQPLFTYETADFSKLEGQNKVLEFLREHTFDKVFLVAGGGPFGAYHERSFNDHIWAWETSFVFHARVLHLLAQKGGICQVILTGSSVAENAADPNAASYCAAKHALKGLFLSLRKENPDWDLRLFSPGYMDTDMLPKNAAVRNGGVFNPVRVAGELWRWTLTPTGEAHKMYPHHPEENL